MVHVFRMMDLLRERPHVLVGRCVSSLSLLLPSRHVDHMDGSDANVVHWLDSWSFPSNLPIEGAAASIGLAIGNRLAHAMTQDMLFSCLCSMCCVY